ncbi:tumor necrosis factor receptor superfamily member 16-like isoform X2 [Montipora foliosa]|uniref:tumor necrosis factor receptor superfamily member 16-like isoform X2 n=1 Tax=Montipora foliosa TaxID=591990 RepID=UPI0035F145D8
MDLDKPALASNQNFCHRLVKVVAFVLFLCAHVQATKPAGYCSKNQFIVDHIHANGSTSCEDCEICPRGQGLSHRCGSRIPSDTMVNCVPCPDGVSFSSGDDTSSCAPCSSCVEGQVVLQKCTSTHDVVCDKKCYSNDEYFDTSGNCLPCSKCCGDEDKVVEECKSNLGAGSDMVCSFNQSANLCDITTTASGLSRNTTVALSTSNATLTPSVTTSLRSNVQSGSSHASSQTVPRHLFEGDESGATREKVVFGVFWVCAFVMYILCKRWILRCRNCSGGNSDVETGNAPHGIVDTELRDVNNTGNNGSGTKEGVTTASRGHQDEEKVEDEIDENDQEEHGDDNDGDDDEEEEEEEPKGLSKPLLRKEPVQSSSVDCQHQDRRNKASKRLASLVNHDLNLLEEICKRLDTAVPGCHNYEVIAQNFRFDYWTIKSDFGEHKKGPSKAMILSIISRYPKVTVEKFASVVEEKALRCEVAELLREYDLREDEDDDFENLS